MPSDHFLPWSMGTTKRFKQSAMKPERTLLGCSQVIARIRTMPALLPIVLTASHLVLAADSTPKFDVERTCQPAAVAAVLPGETRRHANGTNVMRAASSGRIGPDTTRHRSASAPASSRSIARRVMWSRLLAWKWQSRPRTSAKLESGYRRPPVTIRISLPADCRRGYWTSPASVTACMPKAAWVCPFRPLASFFLRRTHLTFRHDDLLEVERRRMLAGAPAGRRGCPRVF